MYEAWFIAVPADIQAAPPMYCKVLRGEQVHNSPLILKYYQACPNALRIKLTTFGLAPFAKANSRPRLYISGR